jgi:uncharacterized protein
MKISGYNIIKKFDDKILVYNSFSKASIFLEKDSDVSAFENIAFFHRLSPEEKEILIDNGFVVDDSRDEYMETKYMYEQKYFDTGLLHIILEPTFSCNFNCPYWCEKDYNFGKENVKKYFQVLRKYAKENFHLQNIVHISLFGGEPLIHAKECIEFLNWVDKDSKKKKYEYFINVTTNGSLLTEDILKELLKFNLRSLQITIDSDRENHDMMRS